MSKRGLHYEHPGQAAEALMQSYERREIAVDDLRLLETDIAVADANCYLEVGLDAIQAEAQARAEAQVTADNPGQIGAVKDLLRDSLARARELVAQ